VHTHIFISGSVDREIYAYLLVAFLSVELSSANLYLQFKNQNPGAGCCHGTM